MTRAKNQLSVIRPERYYFHNRRKSDQHSLSKITRFLTPQIQALFERQSQGMVFGSGQSGPQQGGLIQADTTEIRKKISKLWG
jgi:hypothetical protein